MLPQRSVQKLCLTNHTEMTYRIIIILLFFSSFTQAQNAYHDAVFLSEYGRDDVPKYNISITTNFEETATRLADYVTDSSKNKIDVLQRRLKELEKLMPAESDPNRRQAYENESEDIVDEIVKILKDEFAGNPFIAIAGTVQSFSIQGLVGKTLPSLSSVGNLDVTTLADGLAKFLVERAKQELTIAFFDKFETILAEEKQLQILFPSTYRNLTVIGDQIYQFSGYIDMLRQGFQKDLANLLANFSRLVDDKSMNEFFSQVPELRIILSDGLYLALRLKNGDHIGDALNSYITSRTIDLQKIDTTLYSSVVLLNIVSQSLRSDSKSQYWISMEQLRKLENESILKIYLGLIYQRVIQHQYRYMSPELTLAGKTVAEIMKEGAVDFNNFKTTVYNSYLLPLVEKARLTDTRFRLIRQTLTSDDKQPSYQEYYDLMNASFDLLEQVKTTASLFTKKDIEPAFADKFFTSFRSLSNMYVDLNEKQYVSVVAEMAYLYDQTIVEHVEDKPAIDQEKKEALLKKARNVSGFLIRYGNFIALVAKAETSDEVKQAIEAVALPAGSARIKRESQYNVALNAWVGLRGSYENIAVNNESNFEPSFGVFAPVGVAFSKGFAPKTKGRGGKSLTGFLSLIDIGALASFRFYDEYTEAVPQVQLKDIISPGVFAVYGFGKVPVSLGFGYQMGPRLHKVTATEATKVSEVYHRFSLFLAVDIPIINLYTKTNLP